MKVLTCTLDGPVLDLLVARCRNEEAWVVRMLGKAGRKHPVVKVHAKRGKHTIEYMPTRNWALAGQIIEQERISLDDSGEDDGWRAFSYSVGWMEGPTPLVAAMRVYVASKLGHAVESPLIA